MNFRKIVLQLVVENKYKKVVEIGVWKGDLSRMLYPIVDELILVDPWSVSWNQFDEPSIEGGVYECCMGEKLKTQEQLDRICANVCESMPDAKILILPSTEAAKLVPENSVDLVFIDSVHTYEHCKRDIQEWISKVKPGGMIAGDDYVLGNDVAKAVHEMFPSFLQIIDRVWGYKV